MTSTSNDTQRHERWGELLYRAAADDANAFAVLATELQPYLRVRLRKCHSTRELFRIPEDVEDAVHDTLLAVWEKRSSYNPAGHAVAWLWVIARNSAVNLLRRRSRHRAISLHDRDGKLLDNLAVDLVQPPARAVANEQTRRLRRDIARALSAAEPKVRRAWLWRVLKGQSYAVIARRLGVPQGTIATWLHRFKQSLHHISHGGALAKKH